MHAWRGAVALRTAGDSYNRGALPMKPPTPTDRADIAEHARHGKLIAAASAVGSMAVARESHPMRLAGILGVRGTVAIVATLLSAACATSTRVATDATAAAEAARIELVLLDAPAPAAEAAAPAAAEAAVSVPIATETPVDPLRPEVPIDLTDRTVQTDLWQRVRDGFGIADLDDKYVRKREQYYADQPDYVQRMAERGGRYLFHIVEEVQKRNLPSELALLPFIESAFNPQAMSSARASGMWQFMPATGRIYDLKQNVFRDERRDVLASTRAALDYLTRLHDMFGDWHLALAAYNWGEGNVQRAIKRNQRLRLPADYSHLKMPAETRDYVPKLQAMKNIVANPQAFSLVLPTLHNHPYFLSVPISRDIDVALAARLAELPLEEFQALNPQMNKPVILAAATAQVLLPYDNAATFLKGIEQHEGPLASWTAWVAPKTMKTAQAAQEVGMTEAELRSVNSIPPRMMVKAGSTLLVPRSAQRQTDVSESVAEHATMALAPDGPGIKRVAFRAGKKGDSVAAVAKRYGVSADHVAQWNEVTPSARFSAGTTIVVYVQARTGAAKPATPKRDAKPVKVAAAPPSDVKR
jgi:membrane-bound lytic murein transglycosylase D